MGPAQTMEGGLPYNEDARPNAEYVDADGGNTMVMRCLNCNCRIISANKAKLVEEAEKVRDMGGTEEELHWFWKVNDMFDYDNIGFCRAGADVPYKYITCADCEQEPLGIQYLNQKFSLLSHKKVKYDDPKTTAGHRVLGGGENPQLEAMIAQQMAAGNLHVE